MNGAPRALELLLIAPAPDSGPTGGTLYNVELAAALDANGMRCELRTLATAAIAQRAPRFVLLDSLYLAHTGELRAEAHAAGARLIVLLHYLPSLVRLGRVPSVSELSAEERSALEHADAVLVTSSFMRAVVESLGRARERVLCVEPGAPALRASAAHAPRDRMQAAMLCSVVPGKGVSGLLDALSAQLRSEDGFELAIAGRLDLDPAYAAAVAATLATNPALGARARLLGPLAHREALELLARSDVLVSASTMEAYGMALSEARAFGVPILARAGGHAAAHVDVASGGELVRNETELAAALLALARDRDALETRRARAQAARTARSWREAAAELRAQLERGA